MRAYPEEPEPGPEDFEQDFDGEDVSPVRARKTTLLSLLALAGLLALQAVQLMGWSRMDSRPPTAAQSDHLRIAGEYRRTPIREMLSVDPGAGLPVYPPLYHLSMLPVVSAEDPVAAVRWLGFGYLALLCLCVWGLGRHFLGDWAGFGAALLLSSIPEVQSLIRDPSPDLAAAAWTAAAYWALVGSQSFTRRIPSALFGLLLAGALLTKWTAFSYFLPALWLGGQSMSDPVRRAKALLAAGIAAVLFLPWLFLRWPAVLMSLASAGLSLGGEAPAWSLPGLIAYLGKMIEGMDFPAFLVALVSLVVPSVRRRESSLLISWFAGTYLFWTLVPDRRMSLLLPGIVPLAVLAMGPWPKSVSAGICAFQLLCAFNYSAGWIAPKTLEIVAPLTFFRADPPKKEDWRHSEMLQAAARLHEKGGDGAVTVLSARPEFNPASLDFERRRLGLSALEVRGPSARVCEFSEFFLTKTGSMGAGAAGKKLEGIRKDLVEYGDWFGRGYAEAGRWSLPDGSEASLYARRRPARPPFPEKRMRLDYVEEKGWATEGMTIDFGEWDSERGLYPRITIKARVFTVGGLTFRGLHLELEDVFPVPIFDGDEQDPKRGKPFPTDFRLARLGRLRLLAGEVGPEELGEAFKGLGPQVRSAKVRLEESAAASLDVAGVPVFLEWTVDVQSSGGRRVPRLTLLRFGLGGVAIPGSVLGPKGRVVLEKGRALPFEVDVPSVRIAGGALRIGA